jgi:hypothetical protein
MVYCTWKNKTMDKVQKFNFSKGTSFVCIYGRLCNCNETAAHLSGKCFMLAIILTIADSNS